MRHVFQACLEMDPARRPPAAELMAMPYFAGIEATFTDDFCRIQVSAISAFSSVTPHIQTACMRIVTDHSLQADVGAVLPVHPTSTAWRTQQ